MVAPVIIVLHEGLDLAFQIARREVIFQQDVVVQGLVPALDLVLGLGVEGGTPDLLPVGLPDSRR